MPHPHPSTHPLHCNNHQAPSGYHYVRVGDHCELRKNNSFGHRPNFGLAPIECEFGNPACGGGWQWGTSGVWFPNNLIPPDFNPYQGGNNTVGGNGNGTTVVTTSQINALLNNETIKNPVTGNVVAASGQIDLFAQIKNLIAQNPLIALSGAALLVYLVAKKK